MPITRCLENVNGVRMGWPIWPQCRPVDTREIDHVWNTVSVTWLMWQNVSQPWNGCGFNSLFAIKLQIIQWEINNLTVFVYRKHYGHPQLGLILTVFDSARLVKVNQNQDFIYLILSLKKIYIYSIPIRWLWLSFLRACFILPSYSFIIILSHSCFKLNFIHDEC